MDSSSHMGERSHFLSSYVGFGSDITEDSHVGVGFQLHDLYDHFAIQINDAEVSVCILLNFVLKEGWAKFKCDVLQVKMMMSSSATVPLFEKFSTSASLVSCILPDEPILKQLEVRCNTEKNPLEYRVMII